MLKILLPLCIFCVALSGCVDPQVDANANADVDANANVDTDINTQIETQVESFLKANLESLVKAQVQSQVHVVGADMRQKLADQLRAEFQTQIETHTQNQGMFSGGAIYVVIVVIAFFVLLFGTIIWVINSLFKWKQIWRLLTNSIEEHADNEEHGEHVQKIKNHFLSSLEQNGLKSIVDRNLEKRGLKRKWKS